jgi:hypothetical protein
MVVGRAGNRQRARLDNTASIAAWRAKLPVTTFRE